MAKNIKPPPAHTDKPKLRCDGCNYTLFYHTSDTIEISCRKCKTTITKFNIRDIVENFIKFNPTT